MTGRADAAPLRRAARLARSAAAVPLDDVGAVCGVTTRALVRHLRALPARGECAAAAAAAAAKASRATGRVRALTHRTCPPTAARAATKSRTVSVLDAATGTAAWSGRVNSCIQNRALILRTLNEAPHPTPGHHAGERMLNTASSETFPGAVAGAVADRSATLKRRLAGNESCPAHMLARLFEEPYSDVHALLGANPSTPPFVLQAIMSQWPATYGGVHEAVAGNVSTPATALECLAVSSDELTIRAVAANVSTPAEVLDGLSRHNDTRIRVAVAHNSNCGAATLAALGGDIYKTVRSQAAANPNYAAPYPN